MAKRQTTTNDLYIPGAPATTAQGRNDQLTALAIDAIEKRILEGSASSQELLYFARMGDERDALEKESLRRKIALDEARIESLGSQAQQAELMEKAMIVFTRYQGIDDDEFID